MTQTELARLLGVGRTNISNWENGVSSPDIESLVAIANLFEVTLDELILGRSSRTLPSPLQNEVDQNEHLLSPFPANASLPFSYTTDWLGHPKRLGIPGLRGTILIFQVDGISMSPTIDPGDYIGCRQINDIVSIKSGYAYVVVTEVGIYLKRLYWNNDLFEFRSDNPEYRTFELPKSSIKELFRPIVKISSFVNAPLSHNVSFFDGSINEDR